MRQFIDGTLGAWTCKLNISSTKGAEAPAVPADPPGFKFPMMPSGLPGLLVHGGAFRDGPISPQHPEIFNSGNIYILERSYSGPGGKASLAARCAKANNGFLMVYVDHGEGWRQVATAYGTNWMTISFPVPAEPCKIRLMCNGASIRDGRCDVEIDNFELPE